MKKVYIFTDDINSHPATRLAEEVHQSANSYQIINYSDIIISFNNNEPPTITHKNNLLPDPDIVIFRGLLSLHAIQNSLVQIYAQTNIRILNRECYLAWSSFNKVTQHFILHHNQLPHISTTIGGDLNLLAQQNSLQFPIIVKPAKGSQGRGILKITDRSELVSLTDSQYPFLAQEFLTAGQDIRVIVIGNQVIGAMLRSAPEGQYLTNYSTGGSVQNFDISQHPQVADLAIKAAKLFHCEYVGIDFMQDNQGQWRILELNRACEFEGFEKSTQINVAQKLIKYLLSTSS